MMQEWTDADEREYQRLSKKRLAWMRERAARILRECTRRS